MSKKRVFLALPLSSAGQKKAKIWQQSHASWPVCWLAPENLHLTLVPPFLCPEEDISRVLEKAKQISCQARLKGEKIKFFQVASGPDPAQPRLFWWKGKVTKRVSFWQQELGQNIYSKNFSRPFLPHITLARFSLAQSSSFAYLREDYFWQENIAKVALWESILLPKGAVYRELGAFFL